MGGISRSREEKEAKMEGDDDRVRERANDGCRESDRG